MNNPVIEGARSAAETLNETAGQLRDQAKRAAHSLAQAAHDAVGELSVEEQPASSDDAQEQRIVVITDSCADVPADIAARLGIRVIPLHINYQNASYRDRVDIQPDEVYARFDEEIPKTSTPSPAEVIAEFDAAAAEGFTHAIVVSISSGLSGTYDLMRSIAAGRADMETAVIDTKSIGVAAGFSAILAGELIARGLPFAEVVEQVRDAVSKTGVYFCVDTLDYLYAGGRIGKVTYSLGSKLDIRPVITCDDEGVYVTVAKAHGRKASLKKTVSLVKKAAERLDAYRLAVVHGGAEEEARAIVETLRKELPHAREILFEQISPALVVHTGPGLIGLGIAPVHV